MYVCVRACACACACVCVCVCVCVCMRWVSQNNSDTCDVCVPVSFIVLFTQRNKASAPFGCLVH